MLSEYLAEKLNNARYKLLGDGTYFGEIPSIRGVWASAKTLEDCRTELREVLEDWLVLQLRSRAKVRGLPIRTDRRSLVRAHA